MNTDPLVLPACTVPYPTEYPSPNTCMYRIMTSQPPIPELFSIYPTHPYLFFLLRSSDPPQFSSKAPNPTVQRSGTNIYGPVPLASARQSEGTQTTYGAPVFLRILPADQTHVEFVPGGSISSQGAKDKIDLAGYGYETV
jgi:hypothetical protein